MKISEARKILKHMIQWCFYFQGLNQEMPDSMDYSLEDMLKAGKVVEKAEDKQKGKINKEGKRVTKRSLKIDPRGVAALYVAMSFEGGTGKNPNVVARYKNNFVCVVRK